MNKFVNKYVINSQYIFLVGRELALYSTDRYFTQNFLEEFFAYTVQTRKIAIAVRILRILVDYKYILKCLITQAAFIIFTYQKHSLV